MITFRQLQYLQALSQTGHFGRAAELCHVSQPALSMQIRELEKGLGMGLVERGAAKAALTPDGIAVLERGRQALGALSDIEDLARRRAGVLSGPFRLGVIPSVAPYLLPRLLPVLSERHPELDLRLRETLTGALLDELAGGDLEAVVCAGAPEGGEFMARAFLRDEFLVAAPVGYGAFTGDIESLDSDQLMLLEEGHCLRDQALSVCGLATGRLKSLGATSLATLLQLVAAGRGVTLAPRLAASAITDPRIALHPFAPPAPARILSLVWRRSSPRDGDFRALGFALQAACADLAA